MAGSSSNWFKVPSGPLKGQRVFVSNAALQTHMAGLGGGSDMKTLKARLHSQPTTALLTQLSKTSEQPKGQAQKGGLLVPSDRDKVKFPSGLEKLSTVKSLGGSTGAKLMQDADGNLFIMKRGGNQGHLREEATADAMYHALGIAVPGHQVYETSNGPVKIARHVEGTELGSVHGDARAKANARLRQDFAADALMSNWDVIGMGEDNVLVGHDGTPWRIDNGGSLRYRAQGGDKGQAFGDHPLEVWSLRSKTNPQAYSTFGSLGIYGIAKQANAINNKRTALLAATPQALKSRMSARLDNLKYIADVATRLQRKGADETKVDGYLKSLMTKHSQGAARPSIDDAVNGYNPNK